MNSTSASVVCVISCEELAKADLRPVILPRYGPVMVQATAQRSTAGACYVARVAIRPIMPASQALRRSCKWALTPVAADAFLTGGAQRIPPAEGLPSRGF